MKEIWNKSFEKGAMTWMNSFLENWKQIVTVSGKISTTQEINIGTPQGSRLSPLLFIILTTDSTLIKLCFLVHPIPGQNGQILPTPPKIPCKS